MINSSTEQRIIREISENFSSDFPSGRVLVSDDESFIDRLEAYAEQGSEAALIKMATIRAKGYATRSEPHHKKGVKMKKSRTCYYLCAVEHRNLESLFFCALDAIVFGKLPEVARGYIREILSSGRNDENALHWKESALRAAKTYNINID